MQRANEQLTYYSLSRGVHAMMKRILTTLAAVVAVILSSAPGWSDPKWSSFEPPPPAQDIKGWINFPGGADGSATLWGKLTLPTNYGVTPQKFPPVIILAPGGGLSHDCQMSQFVDAFAREGYATFTFDYATFGASGNGNQPRHTIDPEQQVSELKAAVFAVRSHSKELGVDGDRIALWGVSLSGAHVLVAVSEDGGLPGVRAVCALVPLLADGLNAIVEGAKLNPRPFAAQAKTFVLLLKGLLLAIVGQPWYIPFYGTAGSAAVQQSPEDNKGYASLAPSGGGEYDWRNGMTSSSLFRVFSYAPASHVRNIKVPTSLIAAGNDTICKARYAKIASEQIETSELVILPDIGHFDVWYGEPLEKVLNIQLKFLRKHLLVGESAESTVDSLK